MGAGASDRLDSGSPYAMSARTSQSPGRSVRLSQLRKLSECDQVAAVCYRVRNGGVEFLLVRTRSGGRWTFPKGGAEPGLTHAQAAALEAFEEAGVHGRIEEAAFARYVRGVRGGERKSNSRTARKEVAVSAHLCEVSRLSAPKESGRNRTWFSAAVARQRLREGRRSEDGTEFARVVDKAVACLQRSRGETGILDEPQGRPRQNGPHLDMLQKDGLQRVRFEAVVEARGGEASFVQNIRRQLNGMRQFAVPAVDSHSRQVIRGEVLQFEPAREKKAKALGTGAKSG
jgi:8-oxo-dGTP pyrophosphatase MutT (NUDIX family)